MTNSIASERQRERIPTAYLMEFEEITNDELSSMSNDPLCPREWRAYAGWEIDYRVARGIEITYDVDTDALRRRQI